MRTSEGRATTPHAVPRPLRPLRPLRLLRLLALAALPLLVGLLTAPTAFGGSVLPWRPLMADLDVYRRAGAAVLSGTDIYAVPDGALPFLYPPFAAVLSVPLALPPAALVQLGWLAANVLALLAVLYRLGLTGWVLSLVTAGSIWFVEPVRHTLAYGQLGIFLVALVLLDLVPGPRLLPERPERAGRPERPAARRLVDRFRRPGSRKPPTGRGLPTGRGQPAGRGPAPGRWLPAGVLTGLGAAVKLTPAIFVPFLLLLRERRARAGAIGAVAGFAGFALVAAMVLPFASLGYWGRLATGDSGTESYHYLTNQAVLGTWLRLVGLGGWQAATGMLLAAIVAVLGLWAGVLVVRRDARQAALDPASTMAAAVCVVGVAGLLASPISWSHHFVWVLPLGVLLARRAASPFSEPARVAGWLFVAWVAAAPFMRLPAGSDVELDYLPWQAVLASVTPVLGIGFLLTVLITGRVAPRLPPPDTPPSAPAAEPAAEPGAEPAAEPASGIRTERPSVETWSYAEVSGADRPRPGLLRSAPASAAGVRSHEASTGGDDGGPETAQP